MCALYLCRNEYYRANGVNPYLVGAKCFELSQPATHSDKLQIDIS